MPSCNVSIHKHKPKKQQKGKKKKTSDYGYSITQADASNDTTPAQLKSMALSTGASLEDCTWPQQVLLYVTLLSLAAASKTDPGGEP